MGEGCLLSRKQSGRAIRGTNDRQGRIVPSHLLSNKRLQRRPYLVTAQHCSGFGVMNHRWLQHFTRIGLYATFTCAHLARCAAAIFRRADGDMMRFIWSRVRCFRYSWRFLLDLRPSRLLCLRHFAVHHATFFNGSSARK